MSKKDQIRALLKSIETGDPEPIAVVNEAKYIQHNPQTLEGSEGLASLFARLSKTNPRVNVVRAFEDGDFFFGHTEYDFATRRIGFEVFRFEDGQAVEHWDNIQPRLGPNASGHSMVDGPTEASDLDQTEANRETIRAFVQTVLIDEQTDQLPTFVAPDMIEHNPNGTDGLPALVAARSAPNHSIYKTLHRTLAEGNFVLTVCEGQANENHAALYDLYRVENGKIAEHWDTTEKVAPKSEWKNDNGKF